MLSICSGAKDQNGITLGFDALSVQAWCLMVSSVWSFGSNLAPKPDRNQGYSACTSCSPGTPDPKTTNVPQCPIPAAAQNGNSGVTADLEKSTLFPEPTVQFTHLTSLKTGWEVASSNWLSALKCQHGPTNMAVPNIAILTATRSHTLWAAAPGVTDVSFMVRPLAGG